MTIEERLTQLERKNRRLTLALVSVGMAAILAVAMGQGAPAVVPDEVTAHKFTLVGNNGERRAALIVTKDGTVLGLFDENGKTRVMLAVLKGDPSLALNDENGNERAALMVLKGDPGLTLHDANGKTRAMLAVFKDRPSLWLLDENGRLLRSLP